MTKFFQLPLLGSVILCDKTLKCDHNILLHIVCLKMMHHLFLEFWLVDTWFFTHWRHHRAATCLENVRQPNIRRGKKLGFQLSHKHPVQVNFEVLRKYFFFNTSKFLSMEIFLLNKLRNSLLEDVQIKYSLYVRKTPRKTNVLSLTFFC